MHGAFFGFFFFSLHPEEMILLLAKMKNKILKFTEMVALE